MLPFGVSRKYLTNSVITDLMDRLVENNKGNIGKTMNVCHLEENRSRYHIDKDVLLPAHVQTNALETIAKGKAT